VLTRVVVVVVLLLLLLTRRADRGEVFFGAMA
jgi:hypothetical protein